MIKGKIKLLFIILLVLAFCLNTSAAVKSMTDEQINDQIKQLNDQIQGNKDKMQDIEAKKKEYAANIAAAQAKAATLKGEMDLLDNRIAAAEIDLESTRSQIDQTNLELRKANIEVENNKAEIERDKKNIAITLKLIYKQDNVSTLEMLLLNSSLTDFLDRVKYLEDVNNGIADNLDGLKQAQTDLEKNQAELDQKSADLKKYKNQLEQNRLALESDKSDKDSLLAETKDSESQYQGLIAELKRQQDAANAEISDLEKTIRERMSSLDRSKLALNSNGLIWPVPKNYVTTLFHDPDYPFRYLFEHPAIDIRAAQQTTIVAVASGYVAHARMKGTSYAYIMLIHGDGISTVYGHVNKVLVNEDDYVVQGQPIALSGGLPGTLGSGPFTTGPHLHFEVRQDGVPVNPLEYLP